MYYIYIYSNYGLIWLVDVDGGDLPAAYIVRGRDLEGIHSLIARRSPAIPGTYPKLACGHPRSLVSKSSPAYRISILISFKFITNI